jgi:hypothetical protein
MANFLGWLCEPWPKKTTEKKEIAPAWSMLFCFVCACAQVGHVAGLIFVLVCFPLENRA